MQTVDFFTPIVDDPRLFGSIAAANSVSDVYAMGAEPILALAIAAFPSDQLPLEVLEEIFRGGAEKAAEAGFPIAGGHTIIDEVPKYGLAVTGVVSLDRIVRNSTGRPGDRLYLTKPIGNGILVAAHRARGRGLRSLFRGRGPDLDEAIASMGELNRIASRAMVSAGATAATDVTGYGLAGHLLALCRASKTGARISMSAVPVLRGVRERLAEGHVPRGSRRNLESSRAAIRTSLSENEALLACDAQTSGGLLIAIDPDRALILEEGLRAGGITPWAIGELTGEEGVLDLLS